ncbi:MAG: hypothetical protein QME81_11525 [bacterium]|nr:hypothetical protein [bacterium]
MPGREIVNKNLDLLNEFMKYAFAHPDVLDQIPSEAELVILPTNDPILYKENLKIIKAHQRRSSSVAIIRMEIPEISQPEVELAAAK